MKFTEQIENFPSPVIAIDENMFIGAKNYLASMTFPTLHVGAKISNYTNINFSEEKLSTDKFYGKEYTYFTCFAQIEGNNYTLLFISLTTFGEDLLPFDPIKLYKSKISELTENSDELKNKKRQYIRSVHNNLLKVNYFDTFRGLFENKARNSNNEKIELNKICSALNLITKNFLDTIDIQVNIDNTAPSLIASVSELHIIALLINSLFFSVINSIDGIQVNLTNDSANAHISMSFNSSFDFFELYCSSNQTDNAQLNSAFSLCIAMELCKRCGIAYTINRKQNDGKTHYTIYHSIPITVQNSVTFSSKDNITELLQKYISTVFFDEKI